MMVRNAAFPGMIATQPRQSAEEPALALARELRAFCRALQQSPRQVGLRVARDPDFIISLERGRRPKPATLDAVRRALDVLRKEGGA